MNPTPAQIRTAIRNHQLPNRTAGAKVMDALSHVLHTSIKKPGTVTSGYQVSENSREADDQQNSTPSGE